jgi:hypothetical protein
VKSSFLTEQRGVSQQIIAEHVTIAEEGQNSESIFAMPLAILIALVVLPELFSFFHPSSVPCQVILIIFALTKGRLHHRPSLFSRYREIKAMFDCVDHLISETGSAVDSTPRQTSRSSGHRKRCWQAIAPRSTPSHGAFSEIVGGQIDFGPCPQSVNQQSDLLRCD